MSILDHLRTRRLCWHGDRGTAQYDDAFAPIRTKPDLPFDMEEIDCEPAVQCYIVRHHEYDAQEELKPPEIEAVMLWLRRFFGVE